MSNAVDEFSWKCRKCYNWTLFPPPVSPWEVYPCGNCGNLFTGNELCRGKFTIRLGPRFRALFDSVKESPDD